MNSDEIYTVRMQQPNRNAIGHELLGWLEEEYERAAGRPILLTGSETSFCAGLDLKLVSTLDEASVEPFLRRLDRLVTRMYEYRAPVVACINGHAIAGGCVFAQTADLRVASADPKLRIGLNEVALGACYPPAIMRLMRARIPRWSQERVLLGAELFDADTALELGLVDVVAEDFEALARREVERLASHPRSTYEHTKAILRGGALHPSLEEEQRFRQAEVPQWASNEIKQRVAALLGL